MHRAIAGIFLLIVITGCTPPPRRVVLAPRDAAQLDDLEWRVSQEPRSTAELVR